MRIEYLRYFLAVAECGSISQAAEKLYITQQGLSRIIGALEKEFGVALFLRSNNGIRLTDAGLRAVAWAQRLDKDYCSMLADIQPVQIADSGAAGISYVIYVTAVTCNTVIPHILETIGHYFPYVHFNIIEKLPTEIADEAPLDENSLAILSISSFLQESCEHLGTQERYFEEFFHDILMLSVSRSSPIAKQGVVSQKQLAAIPMALHNTEVNMIQHLLGKDYQPSVLVHTTNHRFCQEIVEQGKAAGLTSALLEYYYPSDQTVMVPLENGIPIAYGCLYDHSRPLSPITKKLLEVTRSEFLRCVEHSKK